MGGFWGSHLGVIDLMLEQDGGSWRIVAHDVETRPISRRNEDRSITALVESNPVVLAAAKADHEATLERYMRKGDTTALEAANPAYETRVFPVGQVKVQGRLVGLIRTY